MFVVSKMGQWMTKAPKRVKEMGIQTLKYVACMEYHHEVGPEFGESGQIPVARSAGFLEIYADASHAGRSTQGIVVAWRSGLTFWESTKQPFVTLSSAESELVAMMQAVQVGQHRPSDSGAYPNGPCGLFARGQRGSDCFVRARIRAAEQASENASRCSP